MIYLQWLRVNLRYVHTTCWLLSNAVFSPQTPQNGMEGLSGRYFRFVLRLLVISGLTAGNVRGLATPPHFP